LEVADIFRCFGPQYREQYGEALPVQQDRALRELMVCRTSVMGLHRWKCDHCAAQVDLFNSCNNRHCPKCQSKYRRTWAEKLQADLLPVQYRHVILTVPRPLSEFSLANPKVLYPVMLRAGAEAILKVGRTWPTLEAEMGVLSLLHTWGQTLNGHVHTHNLVPAGGLSLDGKQWIDLPDGTFLPENELQQTFRAMVLGKLKRAYRQDRLEFPEGWSKFQSPEPFAAWLNELEQIDWVIRMHSGWDRRGEEGAEAAANTVRYLARYVNRVAISNGRLLAIETGNVLFRYKDYRDANQWKTMALPGVEFIRRFLQHMLPQGMHHIRRFGFMGPRVSTERIAHIRQLLGVNAPMQQPCCEVASDPWDGDSDAEADEGGEEKDPDYAAPRPCRHCKVGWMVLVAETHRPTVAELMQMPVTMESSARAVQLELQLMLSGFT
jgi:hypothetical protein